MNETLTTAPKYDGLTTFDVLPIKSADSTGDSFVFEAVGRSGYHFCELNSSVTFPIPDEIQHKLTSCILQDIEATRKDLQTLTSVYSRAADTVTDQYAKRFFSFMYHTATEMLNGSRNEKSRGDEQEGVDDLTMKNRDAIESGDY